MYGFLANMCRVGQTVGKYLNRNRNSLPERWESLLGTYFR